MTIGPRMKAALAFTLTFAAGAASMRSLEVLSAQAKPAAGEWDVVAKKLDLSPEQRRGADSVFARFQSRTDSVLLSLGPRLASISDSIQVELDEILTAEQRARLASMQRPATYLIKRKTTGGTRVDTLRPKP